MVETSEQPQEALPIDEGGAKEAQAPQAPPTEPGAPAASRGEAKRAGVGNGSAVIRRMTARVLTQAPKVLEA